MAHKHKITDRLATNRRLTALLLVPRVRTSAPSGSRLRPYWRVATPMSICSTTAPGERIRVRTGLDGWQRDLLPVAPHPRPTQGDLAAPQHDVAGRMARPRRPPRGLMRIPRTAHGHAILFQHRREDLQARRDDQLLELGLCIDQDVDQWKVPWCRQC